MFHNIFEGLDMLFEDITRHVNPFDVVTSFRPFTEHHW